MIRLLLLAMLLPAFAHAQPFRWTTFTSTTNVRDIVAADGSVWAATTGGLSGYDPATGLFDVYTNTRGLAMNRSSAVGKDSQGWIWAAHESGAITRIEPQTGRALVIDDLRNEVFEITTILDVGDEVFVAANNGIFRFSYSAVSGNYRMLESIRVLGTFPGEARVADLAVAGGYIYAGTTFGLARASLSNEFLSAPSAWTNYTTAQGLPENNVTALFGASDGTLWIATAGNILRFEGSSFTEISATGGVLAFTEWSGAVYAATPGTVYRIDGTTLTPVGQGLSLVTDLITANGPDGQTLVVGIGDNGGVRGGIAFYETDHWTDPLSAHGIASNFVSALGVDQHDRLWVGGGGDTPGTFVYDQGTWTNYYYSPATPDWFFGTPPNGFAFDDFGGTWAGSEGGGVAWFHADSITFFNTADPNGFYEIAPDSLVPRLTLTAGFAGYLVANVGRNSRGDIYIVNRLSTRDLPLMRVSREWISQGNNLQPWDYYTPVHNSMNNAHREVQQIVVDPLNRVWMGAHDRNGEASWVLDDRGTPADTVGDYWFGFRPDTAQDRVTCYEDILTGVTSWAIDHQGYLWVGTHNGVYYTQAGIPADLHQMRFICVVDLPVGSNVTAVHVDGQDNKWFGSDAGVAVMDKNFTWVHVFKTADSPENRSELASNAVTAITSDPTTGDVWIGTTDGLSRLQTPYVSRGSSLSDLWPYPNPLIADGQHRMFIDHQRLGGRFDDFRVYTISGRLVRKLRWSQMIDPSIGWDGRNDDGSLVAGGVYLLIASSTDGNSATGKIAVLGR